MERVDRYNNHEEQLVQEYHSVSDKFIREGGFILERSELSNTESASDLEKKYEATVDLGDPGFFSTFFENEGFAIEKPASIINKIGTTLFTTAGIQILDNVIHNEASVPEKRCFVAQPVFRTQFIDSVGEGSVTSFLNLTTTQVNPTPAEHFDSFGRWLVLLEQLGLERSKFKFEQKDSSPKWGDKEFKNKVIKVYYERLEIGDAVFIYDMPQETRSDLKISDIGFGLERIRWALEGGTFFKQIISNEAGEINSQLLDHCRTLALLVGSGIQPGNKAHGYRVRQLSKRLMASNIDEPVDVLPLFEEFYKFWTTWTELIVSQEEALQIFIKENERNFNRELLNRLKEKYSDVDIDINQPTEKLFLALKGTSVTKEDLEKLTKLYDTKKTSR